MPDVCENFGEIADARREVDWEPKLLQQIEPKASSEHETAECGTMNEAATIRNFSICIQEAGIGTQLAQWQEAAYAKINLGLWVGARDNRGYHPVSSILQSISMADDILITESSHYHVEMIMPPELHAPVLSPADNLITRAYHLLKSRYPEIPTVQIRVTKRIPFGAGLGGGSADAAAIIRWTQRVINQRIDGRLASTLGVDIPFLVCGGTAQATGYGDDLQYLRPVTGWHLVLVTPQFGLSTARVYQAFDTLSPAFQHPLDSVGNIVRPLEQGRTPPELLNALERAAWKVEPKLRGLKADLQHLTDRPWFLTGSGATYFALLRSDDEARNLQAHLRNSRLDNVARVEIAEFLGPYCSA